MQPKKAIWVIDAAYLMKSAPGRFDYLPLKRYLEQVNGQPFFEGYYLNSTPNPPTDQQDSFHTWLKCAPPRGPKLRVQLYKLKDFHCECPQCRAKFDRPVQKGVDVGIATLLIKLASQGLYDRLFLSAGDGDFEDAVSYVKSELHKETVLAGFMGSVSADLQIYCDEVVWLDDVWDQFKKPDTEQRA